MKENSSDNNDTNNNKNSIQDNTGNMYSYNDGKKVENNGEFGAIRRSMGPEDSNMIQNQKSKGFNNSIGRMNPNNINNFQDINTFNSHPPAEYVPRASIVNINQNPPLYWMLFLMFGIIQVIFILMLGFYYEWGKGVDDKEFIKETKHYVKYKYKFFQDITIMIFLGFGFLKSFLKHHSWASIVLHLIGGVFTFEFGLFCLITNSKTWHFIASFLLTLK